ncbi:AraC family transcriptional regulator [Marinobacterium sp. D7]|uniref:AraC family transcriptional regulator n=1 Tax=Marinobacterium ramblicola TaxID=2849041 RepID=UPI001C2D4AE2|nr:AraC family transcriptional regulator [Marinobacterium ramblicola]MBV1786976.1 AraC family transcriptional regulator [Marinobacterium ramblicola]
MTPQLELRSYRAEIDNHRHAYHQLVLPLSGSLTIEIGGRDGQVEARCAAVIHSDELHCFQAEGENRFIVADIPLGNHDPLRLPAFLQLSPATLDYAGFLGRLLSRGTLADSIQQSSCELLLSLLGSATEPGDIALDRRLQLARNYIDRHFHEPMQLSMLSSLAHLSQRQLNTLFQRQLGCTPSDYLIQRRMEQARLLLTTSDDSIQRIAERCGYGNLAAFSDRFRRYFGRSPRHFRGPRLH